MNTVFIKYKVIRGVFALLGSLPPFLQRLLARCLGLAAYAADKKHRRIVTENLSLAYGREKTPEEIRRLAREVFIHFSRVIFEIGWLSRISLRRFAACCRVEGVENYRRALAENRGVFLLTGHIGNWELFAAATAGIIDHPGFVYRPLASPPLELFFREQR